MSRTLSPKEIPALLALLRDRHDREVQRLLQEQLAALDDDALLALWRHSGTLPDAAAMELEDRLRVRQWTTLRATLEQAPAGQLTLEDYVFMVARVGHVAFDAAKVRQLLDDLATGLQERLEPGGTPLTQAVKLADFLGRELGYVGNHANYVDPENSFIDSVLITRKGIPISLSVVYLLVAQRLGLPLRGIGLPGHFIVGLVPAEGEALYLDPYRRGQVLTHLDCIALVQQIGHPFNVSMLSPVSDRYIFQRMLANLYQIYEQRRQPRWADLVLHLSQLAR